LEVENELRKAEGERVTMLTALSSTQELKDMMSQKLLETEVRESKLRVDHDALKAKSSAGEALQESLKEEGRVLKAMYEESETKVRELSAEMVELIEQHEEEDEAMRLHQQAIYLELEATEKEKDRHKKDIGTLKLQIRLGTEKVLATQKSLTRELAVAKGLIDEKETNPKPNLNPYVPFATPLP